MTLRKKHVQSGELTRPQLVSVIAGIRGDLYRIRNATTLKEAQTIADAVLNASCFDVSFGDTIYGELAPMPKLPCLNRRKR